MTTSAVDADVDRQAPLSPLPSPCINVCRMDEASGWCEGCLRSIEEIRDWSSYDDATKRAIWDTLDARHVEWMARNRQASK